MNRIYKFIASIFVCLWGLLSIVGCGTEVRSPGVDASSIQMDAEQRLNEASTANPADVVLGKADVKLTLKTKRKQCFGSAGCNLTIEPSIALRNRLNDYQAYEVTFDVLGDESGPVTQTITITGDNVRYEELFLSVPSSSTKVTGRITSVEEITN